MGFDMKQVVKTKIWKFIRGRGIALSYKGGGTVIIRCSSDYATISGDKLGFEELATYLLTMAKGDVPTNEGQHIHVDKSAGMLSERSTDLVIEFVDDEG